MSSEIIDAQIKRIYIFSFFWMFLVFIPIFVPFILAHDLSMRDVFTLQVVFSVTTLIFEVPSGYMSDLLGRKLTLLIGSIFTGLGYTWFYFSSQFSDFILFEILLGVAVSMASGTDISLLYDWLKLKGKDQRDEATHAIANRQMALTFSEATASILGGLLVTVSFQAVLSLQMITGWIPLLVVLSLKEPPYEKMAKDQHKENFGKVFRHIFKEDPFLRIVFFNLMFWGLATFLAVWTFQKHWLEAQIPLASFGFLWALYNIVVGLVGKRVPHWEKKYGPKILLLALSLLPIMGFLGLAVFSGWLGVIAGLSFQVSRGITQVILKDALNWRTPSAFRATVNSISSLFFRLGFALLGPVVGWSIDLWGLSWAMWGLAVFFGLVFLIFMRPLIQDSQSQNGNLS